MDGRPSELWTGLQESRGARGGREAVEAGESGILLGMDPSDAEHLDPPPRKVAGDIQRSERATALKFDR